MAGTIYLLILVAALVGIVVWVFGRKRNEAIWGASMYRIAASVVGLLVLPAIALAQQPAELNIGLTCSRYFGPRESLEIVPSAGGSNATIAFFGRANRGDPA